MAPLSKALTGVILPYDTYGSHLNASHETIDEALESKNFQAAGEVLGKIWGKMSLCNYPVVAEFFPPDYQKPSLNERSEKWINEHELQTQYCLQISKCANENCCKQPKTSVFSTLGRRFLSARTPFTFDLTVPKDIVFDSFCPSVKKDLKSRTCEDCIKYFATKNLNYLIEKVKSVKNLFLYLFESDPEAEEASDAGLEEENYNDPGGLPYIDASTDSDVYINVF
uniref:Uncharacterized protein n=1 Tax=Panagrolaimus sp. PS1159 TaxID=55785 RepID=A0AC35F622_9BILA